MTETPQRRRISIGAKRKIETANLDSQEDLPPIRDLNLSQAPRTRLTSVEGLFFGCIVGGFAAAIAGFLLPGDVGGLISRLSPIAATLAYPILGISLKFHNRPSVRERFADNCYYLGFIFTQGGLLLAFLPAATGTGAITSEQVMGFFGMALGAALIGMIARTVLIQTGISLTDVSDTIHHEVETLARRVTVQAQAVVEQFDRISEHVAAVPDRLSAQLDGRVEAIDAVFKRLNDVLAKNADELETGQRDVRAAAHDANANHSSAIEELRSSIDLASKAIRAVREDIVRQTGDASKSIQTVTGAMTLSLQSLSGLQSLAPKVAGIEGEVDKLTKASAAASAAANDLSSNVAQSVTQIRQTLSSAASSGNTSIREAAEGSTLAIRQATEEAVSKLVTAGSGATNDIGGQAERFRSEIADATAAFERVLTEFGNRLDAISNKQYNET